MNRFDLQALLIDIKGIEKKLKLLLNQTCECVPPTPAITSTETSVCDGGSTLLETAPDTCITYQWQELIGSVWTNIEGATGINYNATGLSVGEHTYRLLESNGRCVGASNSIVVTVVANTVQAYSSAEDNEFCNGGTTTLYSETLSGPGVYCENPTIQWQVFIPCDGDEEACWTNIPGATSTQYTTPPLYTTGEPGGTYYSYRYIGTCQGCSATSDSQIITIVDDPEVYITAEAEEICDGGVTVLHSEVIGGAGGNFYQWQELVDGTWVDILGANGPDYITDALSTGSYSYRFIVTQDSGCSSNSSPITITVVDDPIVTISADDETILAGGEFTLSSIVVGGTGVNTYQWQYESAPDVWSDIFGANSDTFTNTGSGHVLFDPVSSGSYTFRLLVVQGSGCEAFSNEVIITVT